MTIISDTSPAIVIPGRKTKVFFQLQNASSNWTRVWVTDAPPGSEYRKKLEDNRLGRLEIFAGPAGPDDPWTPTLDVGGTYSFTCQEYIRGSAGSQGYQGAPGFGSQADPLEKINPPGAAEQSRALNVAERLTCQVGTGADIATLVVWTLDNAVKQTTLATHGEATPALIDPSTDRMRAIIETTAVRDAVTALIDAGSDTLLAALPELLFANMMIPYNAHVGDTTVHNSDDNDNDIEQSFNAAFPPGELPTAVNVLLTRMRYHMQNDGQLGGTNIGFGSANYHDTADAQNLPVLPSVAGVADGYAGLADLWRAYEAHRVDTTVHNVADTTNTMASVGLDFASLPKLLRLHVRVFEALKETAITVAPTASPAATRLVAQAGFTRTPL